MNKTLIRKDNEALVSTYFRVPLECVKLLDDHDLAQYAALRHAMPKRTQYTEFNPAALVLFLAALLLLAIKAII